MNSKIYAPNLHFFVFQLLKENPDHLWDYYENTIKDHFSLATLEKKTNLSSDCKEYLYPQSPDAVFQELTGTLPTQTITGLACPLLLYDSYGLALNLRIPEKQPNHQPTELVNLDIFAQFNPNQIFNPAQVNSNLGQTILLTTWLRPPEQDQREKWPQIANQIIQKFLGNQPVPALYQSGQLFGSPMYEYGSPRSINGQEQMVHYLVWLFIDETADRHLGECYLDLIDLWFYRHKITTAYRYSRLEFDELKANYEKIRKNVRAIPENLPQSAQDSQLSKANLNTLKQNLKVLPKLDLDYTDTLTLFRNRVLTVEINTHDYQVKLAQIATKTSPQDLTILAVLGDKVAATFQHQITHDLGYFDQGSQLVNKAIATIRGLVEIDQAERDRDRQTRDRQLQDQLQALGVGIAAGAIVASTSGLITHPWQWPPQLSAPAHPFAIAVVLSSAIALCAWTLTYCILKAHRDNLTLMECARNLLGRVKRAIAGTERKRLKQTKR